MDINDKNFIDCFCLLLSEHRLELEGVTKVNFEFDSKAKAEKFKSLFLPSELELTRQIPDGNIACDIFKFSSTNDKISVEIVSYDNFINNLCYVSEPIKSTIDYIKRNNMEVLLKKIMIDKSKYPKDKISIIDRIRTDSEYENIVLEMFRMITDMFKGYISTSNKSKPFYIKNVTLTFRFTFIEADIDCTINGRNTTTHFTLHENRNFSNN